MQQIDQLDMAKQIVLEPKHYLVVLRKTCQHFVHSPQLSSAFFKGSTVGISQVSRARVDKFRFRKSGGRWPAHQRFAPGDVLARDVRLPGRAGSRIAVVKVKHGGRQLYKTEN